LNGIAADVALRLAAAAQRSADAFLEAGRKDEAGKSLMRLVNLLLRRKPRDALRRSIAEEKASSTPPKKGRKRIEGQGEMLLPIAGNAKKVATATPSERQSARQKNVG
jgi:hypothetical protein